MIEVMAALFVALAAISSLALMLASNNKSSLASQLQISRLSVLQQQIEKARNVVSQYGFSALALNANPAAPTGSPLPSNPIDPNDFITGHGTSSEAFLVESNYNKTSDGVISSDVQNGQGVPEPLLDPNTGVSGGQVSPVQCVDLSSPGSSSSCSALASGTDPYATVYTYVTETGTVGCKTSNGCTGDARRVIVAVLLHHPGTSRDIGPNTPTYSTVVITNPLASDYPSTASGLRVLGLIP
jgi:hypothetical protein